MNSGLVLCLALLTWSLMLPRTAVAEDAMTAPRSHITSSGLNGTPVGPGDPAGGPPSLPGPSLPSQGLPIDSSGEKSQLAPPGANTTKLSPRLSLLANLASSGGLPANLADQDQLLGLATAGAGSLSRDDAGNPVVDVRALDTSEQTLATIAALPADVLSVAPEYATITLAIAPDRLNDLANLAAVQYVGEVLRPGMNASGNAVTGIP